MQKDELFYYYEIRKEDIGLCGFTHEKVVYHRGKPTIKVPVKSAEMRKALKNEFEKCAKQEARDGRCLIPGKNGKLIKCHKSCKDCKENHKPFVDLGEMLLDDTNDCLLHDDVDLGKVEDRATLDYIIDEIQLISPTYARVLRLRRKGATLRTIAHIEGKSTTTTAETLKNAVALARKIFLNGIA